VSRPAGATFAARSGNCLSLVIMTAAFAHAMDMATTFQNVLIGENWSRGNALYMSNLHVNVIIGRRIEAADPLATPSPLLVDFLPPNQVAGFRTRYLPQATIVAMYLNNRAVEELDAGHVDNAYWWARKAVLEHPDFVTSFNTLGVVLERRGQAQSAERAFRLAIEHDPTQMVAMYNLLDLLRVQNRAAEADELAQQVARLEKDPPFTFFNRGMKALEAGNYQLARDMFAREVARAPYNDEFHFWLGIAELRLGNPQDAQREIALAREKSATIEASAIYSAKLAYLRAASRNLH
jgi:tetratricopeptide (TPR) repeat protein